MTTVSEQVKLVKSLMGGMLTNAENLIQENYGITAKPKQDMKMFYFPPSSRGESGLLASNSRWGQDGVKGSSYSISLLMGYDIKLVDSPRLVNGTARTVAHELTHAVMASNFGLSDLPTWLVEGAAVFMGGGDDQLMRLIQVKSRSYGERLDMNSSAVKEAVKSVVERVPGSQHFSRIDTEQYSSSYLAVRYLNKKLKDKGYSGIKDLMKTLSENGRKNWKTNTDGKFTPSGNSLDVPLKKMIGLNGEEFINEFKAKGANLAYYGVDLNNKDVGAAGGSDADGGSPKDASAVISPIAPKWSDQPLKNFVLNWDTLNDKTGGYFNFKGFSSDVIKKAKSELSTKVAKGNSDSKIGQKKAAEITTKPATVTTKDKAVEIATKKDKPIEIVKDKPIKVVTKKPIEIKDKPIEIIAATEEVKLAAAKAQIAYVGIVSDRIDTNKFKSAYSANPDYETSAFNHAGTIAADPKVRKINAQIESINSNPSALTEEKLGDLLGDIYQHLFNRKIGLEGKLYWSKVAKNLAQTSKLKKLPFYILDGAKNNDKVLVENKLDFVKKYENNLRSGLSPIKKVNLSEITVKSASVDNLIREAFSTSANGYSMDLDSLGIDLVGWDYSKEIQDVYTQG